MIYINVQDDGFIDFVNENGQYHRLTGPAIISMNNKLWYIKGIIYNQTQYLAKLEHENKIH